MQPKSNTQFVRDLMEFSDFGGTAQIAVLEAIRVYTKMVVDQPRPEEDDPTAFLSKQLWWDVNADLHRQAMARTFPKHSEEIESELNKRDAVHDAGKLARQMQELSEWKKRDL